MFHEGEENLENQANNVAPHWAPVCEVCKTRDETLRAVSYPYVVSILVMTFQRAFTGIYCKKHQRRYHILASLITSMAGWLGIPYGFIMTPITLFKLARGGNINVEASIQLLTAVANKKFEEGNTWDAIRCLEESIKLQDNPEIRGRLAKLYQLNRAPTDINDLGAIWQLISVPTLLLTSITIGILIGLFDLLLASLLAPLYGAGGSIFVAILSWIPTVMMMFLGVLFVRGMLRWTLYKSKQVPILFGLAVAFASTFFAFYSILEGQAIVRNFQGFLTFFAVSFHDGIFAIRSVLTHGGLDVLANNVKQGDLPNLIFTIILIAGISISLFVGMETVIQTIRWQNRLSQIRDTLAMGPGHSIITPWVALGAFILGLGLINVFAYPGSFVNVESTYRQLDLGLSELNQNHPDEAVNYFKNVNKLWPSSVTGHVYLGLGYFLQEKNDLARNEFNESLAIDPNSTIAHFFKGSLLLSETEYENAINEYKLVTESQYEWGLPHAVLATLYYLLDETELANHEIQLALAYENNDGQTSSAISSYYVQIYDFEKAEDHILKAINTGSNPDDYTTLARIYTSQNKFDQAEKAIEEADRLGADPVNIYLARSHTAGFQKDYKVANAVLVEALEKYPDSSELLSEKSFIDLQLGQINAAVADAEKAVELNPYNLSAYTELAFAYYEQGNLEDALAAAQKGAVLYPKYDRTHYILGLCYMDSGMEEEAIEEFETFLKLYWERPYAKEYKENAEEHLEQLMR